MLGDNGFFSAIVIVYFTWRQGQGTNGLTSPPKDNWWFIGAQSGVRAFVKQNHDYVALWLRLFLYG